MNRMRWIALSIGIMMLSACATTKDLERVRGEYVEKNRILQQELGTLGSQIGSQKAKTDGLAAELNTIKVKTSGLETELKALKGSAKEIRQSLAGGDADITDIRERQEEFTGRMDLLEKAISDLKADQQPLNSRVTAIEKTLDIGGFEGTSLPSGSNTNTEVGQGEVLTDSDLAYQDALDSFKKQDYDQARQKFEKYIEQYPQAQMAGHAQYWIGECFYYEDRYEQAILAYDKVTKNYAASDRVPFALYKQGLCFLKLNDTLSAKLLFQRLATDYADSDPAKLARIKLQEIK